MSITATTRNSSPGRVFSLWDAISLPSTVNGAIAIVVAAVVAGVTAALVLAAAPTYESRATLAIDQPEAVAKSPDTGVIEKLDRLRQKYVGLAETTRILAPVSSRTDTPVGDLRRDTDVVVAPESLLLFPTARADTQRAAQRRAEALADAVVAYADREQADNGIPSADRYRFSVEEGASAATKISPTNRSAVAGAALMAIAAFGAAYVVLQLSSARRRLA
jgi:capsular polysaccharide biosynthesis protein